MFVIINCMWIFCVASITVSYCLTKYSIGNAGTFLVHANNISSFVYNAVACQKQLEAPRAYRNIKAISETLKQLLSFTGTIHFPLYFMEIISKVQPSITKVKYV